MRAKHTSIYAITLWHHRRLENTGMDNRVDAKASDTHGPSGCVAGSRLICGQRGAGAMSTGLWGKGHATDQQDTLAMRVPGLKYHAGCTIVIQHQRHRWRGDWRGDALLKNIWAKPGDTIANDETPLQGHL